MHKGKRCAILHFVVKMRECWNWQTGMTKDHVSVGSEGSSPFSRTQRKESGLFSFERGSDFCFVEKNLKKDFKKLLTATSRYAIIICVPSTRHADVAELAYAHDSGSCEHYARAGSSPAICTIDRIANLVIRFFALQEIASHHFLLSSTALALIRPGLMAPSLFPHWRPAFS